MQRLAEKVSRITSADRLYFERRPDRKHRVRLAGQAEIDEIELGSSGCSALRPKAGEQVYAFVRNKAPGKRLRILAPGPEGAETDIPEAMARQLFETIMAQGVLHLVVRGAA